MRRRLALLVAATTSIVLLAFLVPLAVLIDRAATNSAVATAADRSQRIVPVVAAGSDAEVTSAVNTVADVDFAVTVRMPDGTLLGQRSQARPLVGRAPRATEVRVLPDGRVILDQPVFREDGTAVISTLMSEAVLDRGVWRAWAVLILLGLVLVVLSLVVADRLAGSMTRPVSDLARTAERLGQGDLDARVEPAGPYEIREVGSALNALAARIRELLASERESVADLSHRLRTPVTALQLDAEGLQDPDERSRLVADVDELTRQVDAVIREARRPVREGAVARCDLQAVVADRAAFWRVLADDQGRSLDLELPGHEVPVRSSAADLAAAVDALLGNVFAHTPHGTCLTVRVTALARGGAELVVRDGGPGFADDDVMHRGESRSGSTGLGLDIARRTAVASGGDLVVRRAADGGAEVVVRLGAAG
jgi:signal transduction histidine kinase